MDVHGNVEGRVDTLHVNTKDNGRSLWVISMIPLMLWIVFLLAGSIGCNGSEENSGKIVFSHGPATSIWGDLYIMDWDGGNWTRLTSSGLDAYPKWSPEKDQIVFNRRVSAAEPHYDIYKINADGTGEERLVGGPSDDITPAWSPDGNKLAFFSNRGGRTEIWIYDLRYRSETKLDMSYDLVNPVMAFENTLTWSHDGSQIAFAGYQRGVYDRPSSIWVVDYPSGGGLQSLAEVGKSPNWSKRSDKIVYAEYGNIKVMNGDGTDKRTVTRGKLPAWSLQFDEIVFNRVDTSSYLGTEIYRVQEDGRLLTRLTDNDTNELHPHF
jgi:Tol biopolymer transport system component